MVLGKNTTNLKRLSHYILSGINDISTVTLVMLIPMICLRWYLLGFSSGKLVFCLSILYSFEVSHLRQAWKGKEVYLYILFDILL